MWMLDWGVCFEIPQLLLSVQTMWFPCELMQHISIRGKLLQLIKLRAVCGRKQGNLGTSSQSHPRLWGRAMSDLKELAAAAKTLSTAAAMEELLHTHKHTHTHQVLLPHTHTTAAVCSTNTAALKSTHMGSSKRKLLAAKQSYRSPAPALCEPRPCRCTPQSLPIHKCPSHFPFPPYLLAQKTGQLGQHNAAPAMWQHGCRTA